MGTPKGLVELHFGAEKLGVPALAHHASNPNSPPQQCGCCEFGLGLPLSLQAQPNVPSAASPEAQLHRQHVSSSAQSDGCMQNFPGEGDGGEGDGPGLHPEHTLEDVGHESQSHGVVVPWHTFARGHGADSSAYWHQVPSAAHGHESACDVLTTRSDRSDADDPRESTAHATESTTVDLIHNMTIFFTAISFRAPNSIVLCRTMSLRTFVYRALQAQLYKRMLKRESLISCRCGKWMWNASGLYILHCVASVHFNKLVE